MNVKDCQYYLNGNGMCLVKAAYCDKKEHACSLTEQLRLWRELRDKLLKVRDSPKGEEKTE